MTHAPRDTPPDLVERYRQLKPFDDAENEFVEALLRRPGRLDRMHEMTLRQALNLARLWVVPATSEEPELVVGPVLTSFRDRMRQVAVDMTRAGGNLDPASFGTHAEALRQPCIEAKETLLSRFSGRLLPSALDRELGQRTLVLVVGGGGGCGFVHLGMFQALEKRGMLPGLIVGASIGSLLGLLRARHRHYRESVLRALTHDLTFKQIFRPLEQESRFGFPGAFRFYLRSAFSRFFVGANGDTLELGGLPIPFVCVVTGIRREAIRREITSYERVLQREFKLGALHALLSVKDLLKNWAGLLADLVQTPGGMKSIALGIDSDTRRFDTLDAVGFSCSVPALIQYDVLRSDPRMEALIRATMERYDVDYLVDGGVSANVPARAAWEAIQRGRIHTRNAFILALDCFAPQLRRNMLFLPIQQIAAENAARDRPFANRFFQYRRVLSPASLVPGLKALKEAAQYGREEFERELPFVMKILEPVDPIGAP